MIWKPCGNKQKAIGLIKIKNNMNYYDLIELIKTQEGYTLEFKESLNHSIGREICALANASGGKIILGVKDDGTISGYHLTNKDKSIIQDTARNMDPAFFVKVEEAEEKKEEMPSDIQEEKEKLVSELTQKITNKSKENVIKISHQNRTELIKISKEILTR